MVKFWTRLPSWSNFFIFMQFVRKFGIGNPCRKSWIRSYNSCITFYTEPRKPAFKVQTCWVLWYFSRVPYLHWTPLRTSSVTASDQQLFFLINIDFIEIRLQGLPLLYIFLSIKLSFLVIHKVGNIDIFVQLLMEINWKQLRA